MENTFKMKNIYCLTLLISLIAITNSYSQSEIDDFDDLFIVNQQMYDINNLQPLWSSDKISSKFAIEFEEGQILGINSNYRLLFLNKDGVKIGDIALDNAYVSPNLKYVLTIREQDFWIQDVVDYKELSSPRRLTNLGNITSIYILHWSGDMLYFNLHLDAERYILNTATKELSKFEGEFSDLPKGNLYYNPIGGISPNGNFGLSRHYPESSRESAVTRFQGHAVYNFDKGELIKYPPVTPEFGIKSNTTIWTSPNSFFVFVTSAAETSELYNQWLGWSGIYNQEGNIEILKSYNTPFQGVDFLKLKSVEPLNPNFVSRFNGRSRCVSPDKKYIIYPIDGNGGREIRLLNLETEETQVLFSNSDKQSFDKNSMVSAWSTTASFRWISSTKFIYTTDGDLTTQGTWVFDVETKENRKVSSFVSQKFIVFENSGYTLINANGKLYRLDSNGGNLEEMPNLTNINKNSNLYKLIR